jgi:pimeloyl-ACP methyl ester carboxylesterase
MNLLILPGGENPSASPLYAQVFSVLEREAKRYGFDSVFSDLRWPGHVQESEYKLGSSLTLPGAVKVAIRKIDSMPEGPFVLLARSFGCMVALKIATESFKKPAKIILWGPAPFWMQWNMFKKNLTTNRENARKRGLKIGEDYFGSIEPVEFLLPSVTVPTVVATGTKDIYCTPSFIAYLHQISECNPLVNIKNPVIGAPHEVSDDMGEEIVKSYAETLFE